MSSISLLAADKMKPKKISLFIPIYNEGKILEKNISEIYHTLSKITKNFELFIVDDNSNDGSQSICRRICKKNNKIRYLRYSNGPSRRENLAKSFKFAKGGTIAFIDMDLSTDLSHTKRLFDEIEKGADISIGSRYVKGSYIKRTLSRRLISYFYNALLQHFFNSRIKDHQCGFKAFRRDVLLDIVKDMGYDAKFVRGWFWDAELLLRAQKKSYRIVEFPVKWQHGKSSTFELKRELKMISYILEHRKSFYI